MEILFQMIPPPKEQYCALFETTGWNREYQASPEELMCALGNSQFVVSAYDDEQLVGFGRVITDDVLHAMIYEMIVHPDYQGQRIGSEILEKMIQWCKEHRIRDIQLFCARGKRAFYEKNGFVARPEDSPGMQYRGS
jgi:GNAT superfamily N-acetyltransferase